MAAEFWTTSRSEPGEPIPENAPEAGAKYTEIAQGHGRSPHRAGRPAIGGADQRIARQHVAVAGCTLRPLRTTTSQIGDLSANANPRHYLRSRVLQVDPVRLLPAPPAADSLETRAELDLLLARPSEAYAGTGPLLPGGSQSHNVGVSVRPGDRLHAREPAGPRPTVEEGWKGYVPDRRRRQDALRPHAAGARSKTGWSRAGGKETSAAYPSGHATHGMVYAMILAEIAPEQRPALLQRGREIGWNRVIAGVHYPSDIAAGRVLGRPWPGPVGRSGVSTGTRQS